MAKDWVEVDGSQGEAGGQIVRTALSLSAVIGKPLRLFNMRANRQPSGLRPQHLAAVEAVKQVTGGSVSGAEVGSHDLEFIPAKLRPGRYRFEVGTAGSASLVLQTVALPLALAGGKSLVEIIGGTHNPRAPCYEYLAGIWAPFMARIGIVCRLRLLRVGFYPKGGGRLLGEILGGCSQADLKPLRLLKRGRLQSVSGLSAVSNLPIKVAERQRQAASRELNKARTDQVPQIILRGVESFDRGSVCFVRLQYEHSAAGFFSLGARGKPAELVGTEAAKAARQFHTEQTAPTVDPYAADQLLLPLALADGSSEFTTAPLTDHIVTNAIIVQQMTGRDVQVVGEVGSPGRVIIS